MSKRKLRAIVKHGEVRFGKQVKKLFEERRADLLKQLNRLEQRQKEGWGYRKTWRRAHKVPAHKVSAHWAWLPVKRK